MAHPSVCDIAIKKEPFALFKLFLGNSNFFIICKLTPDFLIIPIEIAVGFLVTLVT